MKYLVVHVPNTRNFTTIELVTTIAYIPHPRHDDKHIKPVHYAESPDQQELVFRDLTGKYPNEIFAKVEVNEVGVGQPGPLQKFKYSNKGILPV